VKLTDGWRRRWLSPQGRRPNYFDAIYRMTERTGVWTARTLPTSCIELHGRRSPGARERDARIASTVGGRSSSSTDDDE
jgi:hypothetical protein